MNKNVLSVIQAVVIFNAGMVTAINLMLLVNTNPTYQAAWWKVAFAVSIAVVFGLHRAR